MAKCISSEVGIHDSSTHSREPSACIESWVEVEQQTEGTLTHNHSEEEFEKLLAAAVVEEADDMLCGEPHPLPTPVFQVASEPPPPAHREAGEEGTEGKPIIVVVKQKQLPHVSREVPHLHKTGARNLSIRGTPLMRGDCFQQLLPLLLVSHLAVFGVGWYLGRRTGFIRA
ncbi:hypothetical protein EMCRGX_G029700 [Ephydatia muelleri]|eukprot:Em0324g2a